MNEQKKYVAALSWGGGRIIEDEISMVTEPNICTYQRPAYQPSGRKERTDVVMTFDLEME